MPRVRQVLLDGMAHVEAVEPRFGPYIADVPCGLPRRQPPETHFAALAESILYQQLAGAAAAAIHGRFVKLFRGGVVTPRGILKLSEEQLRGVGLSGNKTRSMQDLALKVDTGLVQLDRIARRRDATIIEQLVLVRGIGRWTAEMFLLFQLGRLDVWPVDDYGVLTGYTHLMGIDPKPRRKEFDAMGERFAPYRSIAAWYCWRAADTRNCGRPR
jgi:DNA-3-methyladenine glycosylase II